MSHGLDGFWVGIAEHVTNFTQNLPHIAACMSFADRSRVASREKMRGPPHWRGKYHILTSWLVLMLPRLITKLFCCLHFQGIAFCDLPEDTMLPGEM